MMVAERPGDLRGVAGVGAPATWLRVVETSGQQGLGELVGGVAGSGGGQHAPVRQLQAGVHVDGGAGRPGVVAGEGAPQAGGQVEGGALVAARRVGEALLLARDNQIGQGGLDDGGVAVVGPAPEPAAPDQHHPVARSSPRVPTTADDRPGRSPHPRRIRTRPPVVEPNA